MVLHRTRNITSLFLHFARLDRKRMEQGLTESEQEFWSGLKRYLTQYFSPDPHGALEHRASVRIRTRLECSFEWHGRVERAVITNLSTHGVFVQTDSPLPVGAKLWLRIRTNGAQGELAVPGVVATNQSRSARSGAEGGMGIRLMLEVPHLINALNDLYQSTIVREFGDPEDGDHALVKADFAVTSQAG